MKNDHLHVSLKNSSCMFQFWSFKVDPKPYFSYFSLFALHVSTHVSYRLAHENNSQIFSNLFQYVSIHVPNVSTHGLFRSAHKAFLCHYTSFLVLSTYMHASPNLFNYSWVFKYLKLSLIPLRFVHHISLIISFSNISLSSFIILIYSSKTLIHPNSPRLRICIDS